MALQDRDMESYETWLSTVMDAKVNGVPPGLPPPPIDFAAPPADDTPKEQLVKIDPAEIGMTPGYKHLYAGKEDKRGRFQWQVDIPDDLGDVVEGAETEKWAIVVRHIKAWYDPSKVLRLHSIIVQSPLLKEMLKDVLSGYPGVAVGLKRLEFSGRFEPLIHRWPELQAAISKLKSENEASSGDKLKHATLLQDLLAAEFKDTIESSVDMKSQGVMTFDLLWTLFQPGCLVYSRPQNQHRVFRLSSSNYGLDTDNKPIFTVNCQYIDYNGTKAVAHSLSIRIPDFEGTKRIMSLEAFPFDSHPEKDEVKASLIERGAKVQSFAGCHYREYYGVAWRMNEYGDKVPYTVGGRIIIDAYGWNRFNPDMSVAGSNAVRQNIITHGSGTYPGGSNSRSLNDLDDFSFTIVSDGNMPMDGLFGDELHRKTERLHLSEEQKLICTPFVRGYALKEKLWLNFFVNAVQDVKFSHKAFDSLVLQKNQKELILGLTKTQQHQRSQFDDVIAGKGRGIIVLLSGPPGVGKTLTAESVAEEMKVPLYMMSAGDLGLDSKHIERKLQSILDMCTRWNAIFLLDEADVFLTERSVHELERNKLVSIFLRVLEYYEGIMFLTTNRVQTFDAAFQSRIHLSFKYPELDTKSRKMIWINFLKQHDVAQAASRERPPPPLISAAESGQGTEPNGIADTEANEEAQELHRKITMPHTITDKQIIELSHLDMNGRHIKNVLKAAQLLASQRGEGLSREHVEDVMELTQHLLKSTQATDEARSGVYS